MELPTPNEVILYELCLHFTETSGAKGMLCANEIVNLTEKEPLAPVLDTLNERLRDVLKRSGMMA